MRRPVPNQENRRMNHKIFAAVIAANKSKNAGIMIETYSNRKVFHLSSAIRDRSRNMVHRYKVGSKSHIEY